MSRARSALRTLDKGFLFHTTKYEQRMRKLSCKIFNDFYVPELTRAELDYGVQHPPVQNWFTRWYSDFRAWERNQERPLDLDEERNHKFFPAHPQYRALTHTLREYGLFRDEHRDFTEEMKKVAIARGKVFRERRGPISKAKKKN